MIRSLPLGALIAIVAHPALAQDQVELDGGAHEGATTINAAAGIENQQANIGVIALGDVASADALLSQYGQLPNASSAASVALLDGAFAGSSGWLALNGSAGNGNQSANIATFAFGTGATLASDSTLSQARAPIAPAGDQTVPTTPERSVAIGDSALAGSRGLVQVSLVGGDANASANTFALTYDPGANSTGN